MLDKNNPFGNAGILLGNTTGWSNHEILTEQLKVARQTVGEARAKGYNFCVLIRVTLFRDHHAWCPYCQKVWLFLEEKQIPYKVRQLYKNRNAL